MSRVWFCIPSARPRAEAEPILRSWRERGYRVGLWRDPGSDQGFDDCLVVRKYPGYAAAVNEMVQMVLASDPECDWIVTGGDDTEPEPDYSAEMIAAQCLAYFGGTFGVMQPTGDRFADGCIDKVCGSPWMGREFCERANRGRGPLWPEYTHMFVDQELQEVAARLGVFWQRRNLIHFHRHFSREGDEANYARPRPAFLDEPQSSQHWQRYEKLFLARQANGFPGHEPLS